MPSLPLWLRWKSHRLYRFVEWYHKPTWHSNKSGDVLMVIMSEPATDQQVNTPQKFVSAAELSPLPHAEIQMRKSRAKSGDGAVVITSSPYLEKLQILETKKSAKRSVVSKTTSASRGAKRSLVSKTTSTSRATKRQQTKECRKTTTAAGNDDPSCLYCDEKYSASRAREVWVMCEGCHRWSHMECAGLSKKDTNFKCDFCTD